MITFPGKSCFFRFKKSVDNESGALRSGVAYRTGGLPTHYRGSAVDRDTSQIWKKDATTERDPFRIDGAMSGTQSRAIGTCPELTFARPINRDPGKQRLFARERRRGEQKSKANSC